MEAPAVVDVVACSTDGLDCPTLVVTTSLSFTVVVATFASSLVRRISSAFFIALAWISCCLFGSLAMMPIRSLGTGVPSLKLLANFFSSINLTSLSAFALLVRAFSATWRSLEAKLLNDSKTFCSIVVDVGLAFSFAGRRPGAGFSADLGSDELFSELSAGLTSSLLASGLAPSPFGPAAAFDSLLPAAGLLTEPEGAPFASSGLGVGCLFGWALSWDEMIAGSIGAPLTVACAAGARLAGGVYLFEFWLLRGGKSCRLTPLYLWGC